MVLLLLPLFQLLTSLATLVPRGFATNCFYCASPDSQYNATVRRQLATQTDIFFHPIGVKSKTCSDAIDPDIPHIIEGEICSKYSMCLTLFPNLPDSTFVARGCFETILRHTYRENPVLHEEGCYLLRSLPMFPKTVAMDYVACTCHGDYCNRMAMPRVIDRPYSFKKSNILKLTLEQDGSLQIATSSTQMVTWHWKSVAVLIAFSLTWF